MEKKEFVNPYNFIPFLGKCHRSEKKDGELTGVIEYSLLTKTPLYIRETNGYQKDFETGHYSYEFYSYGDNVPVVPSSSVRGMLRSVYEMLTDSCISVSGNEQLLSKRTKESFSPGLIKRRKTDNGFDLYEAIDCLMRTGENSLIDNWKSDEEHYAIKNYVQKDIYEGQKVYFNLIERIGEGNMKPLAMEISLKENVNKQIGYIIKGEDGPDVYNDDGELDIQKKKHNCHIFTLPKHDRMVHKDIDIMQLKNTIATYGYGKYQKYVEYGNALNRFMTGADENEYFPVYYKKITDYENSDNILLMLSPAAITKQVNGLNIRSLLGEYASCIGKTEICEACGLFGMYDGKQSEISRIKVTDMFLDKPSSKCYEDYVTIDLSRGPRLQNNEFYIKRPSDRASYWTYAYYLDEDGNAHISTEDEIGVNGRKFYWHNLDMTIEDIACDIKHPRNITIHPVKKDTCFKGKLYFNNITRKELLQLVYILNSLDEDVDKSLYEKEYGYKLGAAKPLGLGSVALKVDEVRLRKLFIDDENENISRVDVEEKISISKQELESIFSKATLENVKLATNFTYTSGEMISYPKAEDTATHKWFKHNRIMTEDEKPTVKKYEKYLKPLEKYTKYI